VQSDVLPPCSDLWSLLFYARSQNCKKRLLASSCPSAPPHGITRLPLDGFVLNLILKDFLICRKKFKLHLNLTRIMGTLREDLHMCMIISR
jgi:hypothetical protein